MWTGVKLDVSHNSLLVMENQEIHMKKVDWKCFIIIMWYIFKIKNPLKLYIADRICCSWSKPSEKQRGQKHTRRKSHLFVHEYVNKGIDDSGELGQQWRRDARFRGQKVAGPEGGEQRRHSIGKPADQVAHHHGDDHQQHPLFSATGHHRAHAAHLRQRRDKEDSWHFYVSHLNHFGPLHQPLCCSFCRIWACGVFKRCLAQTQMTPVGHHRCWFFDASQGFLRNLTFFSAAASVSHTGSLCVYLSVCGIPTNLNSSSNTIRQNRRPDQRVIQALPDRQQTPTTAEPCTIYLQVRAVGKKINILN